MCLFIDISTPTVAFLAELSKTIDNPSVGSGIIFDVVHLNDGNSYDNVHGVFRAPVNGVYHFTAELTAMNAPGRHEMHLFMMKSSTQIGYMFLDWNDDMYLKRNMAVTAHLAKNDDVWIKVGKLVAENHLQGCCFHSIFSGFLIKKD